MRQHGNPHLRTKHGQQHGTFFAQSNDTFPIILLWTETRKKKPVPEFNHWFVQFIAMSPQKDEHKNRQSNGVQDNLGDTNKDSVRQMPPDVAGFFKTEQKEISMLKQLPYNTQQFKTENTYSAIKYFCSPAPIDRQEKI